MRDKCPVCLSCLDATWIGPKRFFFCDFCLIYYDIIDFKLVRIGTMEEIQKVFESNSGNWVWDKKDDQSEHTDSK